jgi:branched-chain amino acid transport system substrate-binding protein
MDILAGCVTTDSCNAVAPETVADKMFMFTPSGSATSIAMAGPNVFQMCFTDPNQGASAAELIQAQWADAVVGVIYDSSDPYSKGIYDGFTAKATELGLNVQVVTSFTKDSNTDLSTQVTQCKDAGCTLVFLPIYYTEASRILNSANDMQYDPVFFGCDGMDGILSIEGFDPALAEGLVLMTPFDANATDEATVSFVNKYKEQNNGQIPNQFAADGYDVVYAIYEALTAAGLDGTASSQDICAALVKWFNETEGFDGLTGQGMTWDEGGMISKMPAAKVIENGVYVPLA